MIALRRLIERGIRHPLLGPLCMILLALLLAFTVLHGVHDQIHEGELVVCVVFLISAVISIAVPRLHVARLVAASVSRAPPSALLDPDAADPPFQAVPVPLRL